MSSSPSSADPLQKLLDEAESELSRRLHDACVAEAHGVSNESSAEIRRLEDTLLSAAMAAERAIAARRHLHDAQSADAKPADATAAPDATAATGDMVTAGDTMSGSQAAAGGTSEPGTCVECASPGEDVVRQFEDETGRRWRAWPVVPDARRAHLHSLRTLGEYQDGWICFEALDETGRRRLPGRGQRWTDLPAEELPRLLAQAIAVPARKGQLAGPSSESAARDLH
jgi:hypothetical protein